MQRQKWVIEEILEENDMRQRTEVHQNKTFAQGLYELFFGAEAEASKPVIDESGLRNLLRDIHRQMPFYLE